MNKIINLDLMAHPMNWLVIFMMLVIAAVAGHEILALAKIDPATPTS